MKEGNACALVVDGAYWFNMERDYDLDIMKAMQYFQDEVGVEIQDRFWLDRQLGEARKNYLRSANGPKFSVKEYPSKNRECPICHGYSLVQSGCDVGIALRIFRLSQEFRKIVLIAGDGDFEEALEYAKEFARCEIYLATFQNSSSTKLHPYARKVLFLDVFDPRLRRSNPSNAEHENRGKCIPGRIFSPTTHCHAESLPPDQDVATEKVVKLSRTSPEKLREDLNNVAEKKHSKDPRCSAGRKKKDRVDSTLPASPSESASSPKETTQLKAGWWVYKQPITSEIGGADTPQASILDGKVSSSIEVVPVKSQPATFQAEQPKGLLHLSDSAEPEIPEASPMLSVQSEPAPTTSTGLVPGPNLLQRKLFRPSDFDPARLNPNPVESTTPSHLFGTTKLFKPPT